MNRTERASNIIAILQKNNPHPATELTYKTSWQLLVAAILSAQSTDKQVNIITASLFAKYPTPQDLVRLSPEELAEEIKTIGLFRSTHIYL